MSKSLTFMTALAMLAASVATSPHASAQGYMAIDQGATGELAAQQKKKNAVTPAVRGGGARVGGGAARVGGARAGGGATRVGGAKVGGAATRIGGAKAGGGTRVSGAKSGVAKIKGTGAGATGGAKGGIKGVATGKGGAKGVAAGKGGIKGAGPVGKGGIKGAGPVGKGGIKGAGPVGKGGVASTRKGTGLVRGPGRVRGKLTRGPGRSVTRSATRWKGWKRPGRIVVVRGPRRMWVNGFWRTFVPLTALGVLAIGAETYYADGYVSMPGPVCTGVTEDGCQLRWQEVPTVEGESEYQCVQYCAQPNRSLAQVTLPAEPEAAAEAPATQGVGTPADQERTGCDLTIYAEPNLKGASTPSTDDQVDLTEDGWASQIASLEIRSGTWDFYSGPNYSGDAMRLSAGSYPTLDPKWTRSIGSFMCTSPAR